MVNNANGICDPAASEAHYLTRRLMTTCPRQCRIIPDDIVLIRNNPAAPLNEM